MRITNRRTRPRLIVRGATLGLASLLSLVVVACSKSLSQAEGEETGAAAPAAFAAPKVSGAFSCDDRKTTFLADMCTDFTEKGMERGEVFMKQQCTSPGSVFAATACPKEGVIGSCTHGHGLTITRRYGGGVRKLSAQKAREECIAADNGTPL